MSTSPHQRQSPEAEQATDTELRDVLAQDPQLSPETNAMLTDELRDVVEAEQVRVPVDRPHATRGEFRDKQSAGAYLSANRFNLLRAGAITLTFGAILALITGYWWLLPVAAGVHALGTMTVLFSIVRLTTESEHPSPEVAAAMAEDGVRNPDERFTEYVEEFSATERRGVSETLGPGFNERTASARDDTATAAEEQSSSMTPTSDPSQVGGQGGEPDMLIWATAGSLLVLSIVLPAVAGGGWLWLLPAVMLPLIGGWVMVQRLMITHEGDLRHAGVKPLVTIAGCTAIAVAVFCALVGLAFNH